MEIEQDNCIQVSKKLVPFEITRVRDQTLRKMAEFHEQRAITLKA